MSTCLIQCKKRVHMLLFVLWSVEAKILVNGVIINAKIIELATFIAQMLWVIFYWYLNPGCLPLKTFYFLMELYVCRITKWWQLCAMYKSCNSPIIRVAHECQDCLQPRSKLVLVKLEYLRGLRQFLFYFYFQPCVHNF